MSVGLSPGRRRGFTLVEILIVVIILGVLASIVIPQFASASTESRTNAFASSLKTFTNVFEVFHARTGEYPGDINPGEVPVGLEELANGAWVRTTPIGGQWDWDFGQFGCTAGISVFQPDRTDAEMRLVDQLIDDGDLTTGKFRQRDSGYIFELAP